MKKKYVVYCITVGYDCYGLWNLLNYEAGTYEDYESALIRAYELRCLGYNVKIEEE